MSDIKEKLARILSASEKLNELGDAATKVIRELEQALLATGSGIDYQSANLGEGDSSEWLAWTRHQGQFRLMHNCEHEGCSSWTPLVDSRREDRIRAVTYLASFVAKYRDHVLSHVDKMEKTMADAQEANADLGDALKGITP